MKKKVLYGFFMGLLAVASMGSLQSCKDDFDGYRAESRHDITSLKQQLETLDTKVGEAKTELEGKINTLDQKVVRDYATIVYVDGLIDDLNNRIDGLGVGDKTLDQAITDLLNQEGSALNETITGISGTLDDLNTNLGEIDDQVASIEGTVETLSDDLSGIKQAVKDLRADYDGLAARVLNVEKDLANKADKVDIERLDSLINGIDNQIIELWMAHEANQNFITNVLHVFEDYQVEVANTFGQVFTDIDDLRTLLSALSDKVDGLGGNIDVTELENMFKTYLDNNGYVTSSQVESIITSKGYMTTAEFNTALDAYKAEMQQTVADIYAEISNKFNEANNNLNNYKSEVATKIQEVMDQLIADKAELQDKIDALTTQVNSNTGDVAANKAKIAELETKVGEINNNISTMSTNITTLQTQMSDLQKRIDEMAKQYGIDKDQNETDHMELWQQIRANEEYMTMLYNLFNDEISALNSRMDEMFKSFDDRINQLITGIILQGSFNSYFGTLNLPVGIKSNLLFSWYGKVRGIKSFDFPTSDKANNYLTSVAPGLTDADLMFLMPSYYPVNTGDILTDGNLGRVYMTVNPTNVDFSNAHFYLETSSGSRLPYSIDIQPCDEELAFGYSRSKDNGFYKADVSLLRAPDLDKAISATKFQVEPGLKTALKDAFKDRSARNAEKLLKAVYDQFNDFFPAYGVRAEWPENGKTNSVLSNYDLAIATVEPLSYRFYAGEGELTSYRLRTFGHLDNLFDRLIGDLNDFHFNLKDHSFTLDSFEVSFTDLKFEFEVTPNVDYTGRIKVTIPSMEAEGWNDDHSEKVTVTVPEQTVYVEPDQLKDLIDAINNGFSDAIKDMNDQLNDQINDEIRNNLIKGINDQVNDMLSDIQDKLNQMLIDMEGEINGKLDDLISDIKNKVNDLGSRFNRFIDIYNRFANQVNRVLADPSHYLQPAMFYTHNGGLGVSVLSTKKSDPTPFQMKGGNAISVFASSYSGELVAPAFKKYIAVSNVYNKDGQSLRGQSKYANQINAINKASELNRILPGGQKRVAISTSQMEKGLTYEIVYQGLDYQGITSTRKFYIKVK